MEGPQGVIPLLPLSESGSRSDIYFGANDGLVYAFTQAPAHDKMAMVRAHQLEPDNPHLPAVDFLGTSGNFRVFRMPAYEASRRIEGLFERRADDTPEQAINRRLSAMLYAVSMSADARAEQEDVIYGFKVYADYLEESARYSREHEDDAYHAQRAAPAAAFARAARAIERVTREMAVELEQTAGSGRFHLDLHAANYALDSKKRLVLLDPVLFVAYRKGFF